MTCARVISYHLHMPDSRLPRVTGQKDPAITLLSELVTEQGRRKRGLFIAEGLELATRAFDYGGRVTNLLLSDRFATSPESESLINRALAARVSVQCSTEGLLAKVLEAKPTPECLAIVERKVASLDDVLSGDRQLVLMVEHGENADNLGMLLRSTDAAGLTGVVLAADTVDPFGRRVVRGSRGAVFTVPIAIQGDVRRVIEEARKRGLRIVATSANSSTGYTSVDLTIPTLIVVGNEHVGISDKVRQLADEIVRIPMLGRINSLNIAVAASVVLYEAVRQRS